MSDPTDDINDGPPAERPPAVMDIIKGKATASELARSHGLTVAEVEQWMDDFISQGTEALRSHPRDALFPSESLDAVRGWNTPLRRRPAGSTLGHRPRFDPLRPGWLVRLRARHRLLHPRSPRLRA